jgi:hypothetical protein
MRRRLQACPRTGKHGSLIAVIVAPPRKHVTTLSNAISLANVIPWGKGYHPGKCDPMAYVNMYPRWQR